MTTTIPTARLTAGDAAGAADTVVIPTVIPAVRVPPVPAGGPDYPGTTAAALFLIPAGVMLLIGLVGASGRELWSDEYATWSASTLSWRDLRHLLHNYDIVHGLYYAGMHLWISAAGTSPIALRTPSLLAAAAAAGMLAQLGARLVNHRAGLIAGLLVTLIPAVSRYAQEARSYATVALLTITATLLLHRAMDRPRGRLLGRRWMLYGAVVAVLGWLHFVALLTLAAHLALVVHRGRREHHPWRWLTYWGATVTVPAVLAVPLLLRASHQMGQVAWIEDHHETLLRFPAQLLSVIRPASEVTNITLDLALVGAVLLWWINREALTLLVASVLGPVAVTVAATPLMDLLVPRYLLFVVPSLCLLAAVAVEAACRLVGRAGQRGRSVYARWAAVITVALLIVGTVGVRDQLIVRSSPVTGQPDLRAVAARIATDQQPGDGIAYADQFGSRRLYRQGIGYELRGRIQPRDVFVTASASSRGLFIPGVCLNHVTCVAALGDTRRVWLVATDPTNPYDGVTDVQALLLRGQFTTTATYRYADVHLLLLTRRT